MEKKKRMVTGSGKPVTFLCLLVTSLFMCCQVEDQVEDTIDNGNSIIDDDLIIYTDIIPDDTLVSIDFMLIVPPVYPAYHGDYYPSPPSGQEELMLDVDGDGKKDLRVAVLHSSPYCDISHEGFYYYTCLLKMEMLDEGDCYVMGSEQMAFYKENDTVSLTGSVDYEEILRVVDGGCPGFGIVYLDDAYFGFKKDECLGWIHLDRVQYGVVVMDLSINLALGRNIVCKKP